MGKAGRSIAQFENRAISEEKLCKSTTAVVMENSQANYRYFSVVSARLSLVTIKVQNCLCVP